MVPFTKHYSGDTMEEDMMGEACSTYGENRNIYKGLDW